MRAGDSWGIEVTVSSEWQLWHFHFTHSHFIHSHTFPLSPQISSAAMIRLCWGQPCFDLPPIPKFKFYKQRWRLAIGHFGQTNNHDWPQNYAANPSLMLPMAPGIAPHLQTAENPLVQNQKNLKQKFWELNVPSHSLMGARAKWTHLKCAISLCLSSTLERVINRHRIDLWQLWWWKCWSLGFIIDCFGKHDSEWTKRKFEKNVHDNYSG